MHQSNMLQSKNISFLHNINSMQVYSKKGLMIVKKNAEEITANEQEYL